MVRIGIIVQQMEQFFFGEGALPPNFVSQKSKS